MHGGIPSTRAVLVLIAISSGACLCFEIALMRFFSITLWYHFAFMVISIAMLGIGAAGTLLCVAPAMQVPRRIPLTVLCFAASLPLSLVLANAIPFDPAKLSWDRTQLLLVGLYYAALAGPFLLFGIAVATAYTALPGRANALYASDLAGAGSGAIAAAGLLSLGGPEQAVVVLSAFVAAGVAVLAAGALRTAAAVLLLLNIAAIVLQPDALQPRISPYKPLEAALRFPGAERAGKRFGASGRIDFFTGPAARAAPGMSFTYLDPLPAQTGLAIDAGEIHAITDGSDSGQLRFLRALASALAYRLGVPGDVLVLEPRGGLAVLQARMHGAKRVVAVDSNPLVIEAVRDHSRSRGSSLYEQDAWSGLGRTWLRSSGLRFDVIDLSLTGTQPTAGFGFSEDYRFTVEAFREYLAHLAPDGVLALNLYLLPPPRTEFRLVTTLADAARSVGISDLRHHVAAVRSWDTLAVAVKRSPLTPADIGAVKSFCRELRFDPVAYPGIRPGESNVHIRMPDDRYADFFRRLLDPDAREQAVDDYLFDVRPATDDRPFFHYHLRLNTLRETYRLMGEKWQYFVEEGFLLPLLALQAAVASVVLILLPLARPGREGVQRDAARPVAALSYFALLGLAYLFVETVLVQRMVLAFENVSTAASTIIAALLISSGAGSMASRRIAALKAPSALLAAAGVITACGIALPWVIGALGALPLWSRVPLAALAVAPAGFVMGIPFPRGMDMLVRTAPGLVPWAWAVNGCFSVLAPVLAVMVALVAGYRLVMFAGAGCYLAAFVLARPFGRSDAGKTDAEWFP